MAVSMRDLDQAFQGAGQKAGLEVWRIENFRPVLVPKSSHGKFFMGDSYIVLKTTSLKSGALRHDIHYWLGKDTTQDEAGTAAIKTVELDAALGGRAVQYREVQGHETEKFLSYFKPCIIPQEGGVSSGFKHAEAEEHKTILYICKGKRVVHVKEVPFARSSLNHDDIFILDTKSKIFQFNGSNSSIQERAKALEVVQYIKDTYHDGKCEVAAIEDGKLMADVETGEFWALFGGFAPLPRKVAGEGDKTVESHPTKLLRVEKGNREPIEADSLARELLETNKCYILDSGTEVFIWMGRNSSLDERKNSSRAAEELVTGPDRPQSHIMRVIEGFEPIIFRAKFDSWPETAAVAVSEDGRGKVAALLKRQGINVKGLLKAEPVKEEPQPYIDCTGNLQVWRVSGQEKLLLPVSDQTKFYTGDCYIFQYSYSGEDKEEFLVGTWFGKQSVEGERAAALSLASKMVESLKFLPVQARIYEGHEPIQFYSIFQSFIVFKGGLSDGYKNYITENEIPDVTDSEDGVALFRVQGSGPENMQAIQVEAPNCQSKPHKEGAESEQFWDLLGGKVEYPSQKIARNNESDPHLFSCTFAKENLKVAEIYNFGQDDLMTEDIDILSCHSDIFVWVGQQVDPKTKVHALKIGEKFLEIDFFLEKLSRETPVYIVMEGSEPPFFTRFFSWDSAKSAMHGNSFQRKFALVRNGGTPTVDKPKRRAPVIYGGRSSSVPEKSQRSRSVSFSPDRVRVRGRSPAFNALAANFENPNARNLSTPPPMVRKLYPKSVTPDSSRLASKNAAIAALSASFEQPLPAREVIIPRSLRGSLGALKPKPESDNNEENSMSNRIESLTIAEDVKEDEVEDEEGLTIHPYESLATNSSNPVSDIDVTKRETYLSSAEFREKFGMAKDAFYKLPKWKQNKLKMALHLF
ncbi:villin-4 isoform X3 [Cucumis sativus]|uniref:villin-4 isoform X3 n=1 Tax=Cucumis sativus TaxID=3659 RepID=UPI0012F4F7EF|nr:villin-4 isoform X3 [Cucumis sativus]